MNNSIIQYKEDNKEILLRRFYYTLFEENSVGGGTGL